MRRRSTPSEKPRTTKTSSPGENAPEKPLAPEPEYPVHDTPIDESPVITSSPVAPKRGAGGSTGGGGSGGSGAFAAGGGRPELSSSGRRGHSSVDRWGVTPEGSRSCARASSALTTRRTSAAALRARF